MKVTKLVSEFADHLDVVQESKFEKGVISLEPRKQAIFVSNKYDLLDSGNCADLDKARAVISQFVAITWGSTEFFSLSSTKALAFVTGNKVFRKDSVDVAQITTFLGTAIPCSMQSYRNQIISQLYYSIGTLIRESQFLALVCNKMDSMDRKSKGRELTRHIKNLPAMQTKLEEKTAPLIRARFKALAEVAKARETEILVRELVDSVVAVTLSSLPKQPSRDEYLIELLKAVKKYNRWISAKHPEVGLETLFTQFRERRVDIYYPTMNCFQEASTLFSYMNTSEPTVTVGRCYTGAACLLSTAVMWSCYGSGAISPAVLGVTLFGGSTLGVTGTSL